MKRVGVVVFIVLFFPLCKSPYEMIRTGPEYPPLPKDAEVTLVPWTDIDKYEQIAIVDVGEFTLEKRTKYAKEAARKAGGEFIAAKLSSDEEKNKRHEYLVQTFVILKKKTIQEKQTSPKEVAMLPKISEPTPIVEKESKIIPDVNEDIPPEVPDYSTLPRASFRMLLKETESLKGEKFRGSLYPVKYFRVPPELKNKATEGKQLLMLSNQSGSAKVLLFIPREHYYDIQEMIKEKKRFEFVYTPLTVYRSKYPVLEYLDTIK
ncbi:MAG: hypothetical protein N2316_05490 [Spirochaetes bacterium]|nr:hypothetical protein [Spirochaetota bacterium]